MLPCRPVDCTGNGLLGLPGHLHSRLPGGFAASIDSFNLWLALKVTTRLAVMRKSSPVFGLRPGLGLLSRSSKFPKPASFTSSPFSSEPLISSNIWFTSCFASGLSKPDCPMSWPTKSALVKVMRPHPAKIAYFISKLEKPAR